MKTALILLASLLACSTTEQKFIIISPEPGAMSYESENGAFGQSWTTQTYFLSMIQEDGMFGRDVIKLKHDFIVVKLKRTFKEENKAYEILDMYNAVNRAERAEICEDNAWSEEMKKEIRDTRAMAYRVNTDLRKHVKINIEPEALITGISENGFLTYQP